MAYDEGLAERIRGALHDERGITEKKMFGGVGYLLDGNMAVGVWKDSLVARVGPDAYPSALEKPHAAEFNVTGRAMKGWVLVAPEGIAEDGTLQAWIDRSLTFVRTLPPK